MIKRIKSVPRIQKVERVAKRLFQPYNHQDFVPSYGRKAGKSILIVEENQPILLLNRDKSGRKKSRSSMEIFKGAHSVDKKQTFLRQKSYSKPETASAMMARAQQIRKQKLTLQKVEDEVEKKLRITQKINSTQLFLDRSRKSKALIQQSSQIRKTDTFNANSQSAITIQLGMSEELPSKQKLGLQGHYQSEEHFMEKKQTPRWDYPIEGLSEFRADERIDNQSQFRNQSVNLEILSSHFQNLNATLKQSIRDELVRLTEEREQKLKKEMDEKQERYLSKIQSISKQISSQLESEKQIMRSIVKQAEESQKNITKLQNQQNLKKQRQYVSLVKEQESIPIIKTTEARPIERQPSKKNTPPKAKKAQEKEIIAPKSQGVKLKTEQRPKASKQYGKAQTIFQQQDEDSYDDLQEIKLNTNSKKPQNILPRDIDRSFNVGTKLNESFGSEQPTKNRSKIVEQKPMKPIDTKSVKNSQNKSTRPKDEKEEKARFALEKKKQELRAQLKQEHWQNPYLTEIGKVVIECSKNMKKSKLQWRVPSLLLYRYCYDCYDSYSECYDEALDLGMIKKQEVDTFKNQINQIKQTMLKKILPVTLKKVKLNSKYQAMIESKQNEVQDLRPIIDQQVNQFLDALNKSEEVKDPIVTRCGLRMINALFIMRKLGVDSKIQVIDNIDNLPEDKCVSTYRQWVVRLQKMWRDEKSQ